MITTAELKNFVLGKSGFKKLNPEEGTLFGLTSGKMEKVVVCWMATDTAIQYAVKSQADAIICHESLFLPCDPPSGGVRKKGDFLSCSVDWSVNKRKVELLSGHHIGVYRLHGNMDRITIMDTFAGLLGLKNTVYDDSEKYHRIVEVAPITLNELAGKIKKKLHLKKVLLVGDKNKKISRASFIWGGMGLFVNTFFIEQLIALNCDVMIGGESDEYAMQYIKESGVCAIITSHVLSERPGVKKFSELLIAKFKKNIY